MAFSGDHSPPGGQHPFSQGSSHNFAMATMQHHHGHPNQYSNHDEESRRSSADYQGHGSAEASPGERRQDEDMKRRKIMRACDVCRRKKIKCDGPMNSRSSSKCAHCQEYKLECTYVEMAKRRGPPKGYVEAVEQRCARLEHVLQQLHPGMDFNDTVGPLPDRDDFEQTSYADALRRLRIPPFPSMKPLPHNKVVAAAAASAATQPPSAEHSPLSVSTGATPLSGICATSWRKQDQDGSRAGAETTGSEQDELEMHSKMAETMQRLNMKDNWRFHGKASPAHLLRLFSELKYKSAPNNEQFISGVNAAKRDRFWHVPEWEVVIANEGVRPLDFSIWPPPELAKDLIDAYFRYANMHLPLLNRPMFVRQYASDLHRSNHEFAKVCLMVFANGARYVDDPRVLWPNDVAMSDEGKERLKKDQAGMHAYSAGWTYLQAVLRMGRSIVQGPSLFDFQCQVLMCEFLHGAAVPHLTWLVSGLGLRLAQEIGIHVRSTLLLAPPVERALYSRAFWCLYHIDRMACMAIGRAVGIQDTDFDADYPVVVDDEYWDTGDPSTDFKQPESAGVPEAAAFVHMLKLDHIIGAALQTIYAIRRHPDPRADPAAQRAFVVELDSALNSWVDAMPDGLRWDPTRSDQRLFEQSAVLYAHYYCCQILIHRSFIPTPRNPETVGLPSLAICTNASRSICNILDAILRRGKQYNIKPGQAVSIQFLMPIWVAAIILLVGVYSGKQPPTERDRAIADVQKCIEALKDMERTWRQAGKMTDMLIELSRNNRPAEQTPSLAPQTSGPSSRERSGPATPSNADGSRSSLPLKREHSPSLDAQVGSSMPYALSPTGIPALRAVEAVPSQSQPNPPLGSTEHPSGGVQVPSMAGAVAPNGGTDPTKRPATPPPIFGMGTMINPAQPWLTGGEESLFDPSFYDFGADLLASFGLDGSAGAGGFAGGTSMFGTDADAYSNPLGLATPGLASGFGAFGGQMPMYGTGPEIQGQGQGQASGQGMQPGQQGTQGNGGNNDNLAWMFGPGR